MADEATTQSLSPLEKLNVYEISKAAASNTVSNLALQAKVEALSQKVEEKPASSNFLIWAVAGLAAVFIIWKGKLLK